MNKRLYIISILLFQVLLAGLVLAQPKPPMAPVVAWSDSINGFVRSDDYHWLKERSDPRVKRYLEAENAYTDSVMAPTRGLQKKLYREFLNRIKQTDLSVPVKRDSFYYYSRTVKGQDYYIYCRKKGSLKASEEILLDENKLARGHSYYSIDITEVSPDHSILAYAVDTSGAFVYDVHFKDMKARKNIPGTISGVRNIVWANDSRTVYYEAVDSTQRSDRVFRRRLGEGRDSLIYHETDPRFWVSISKTFSQQYLFITSASKEESELRYLNAGRTEDSFKLFRPRRQKVEYWLEHHGPDFYIFTNDSAQNYRLLRAPISDPAAKNWVEVIPHRPDVLLENVLMFRDFMAIQERTNGLSGLKVIKWGDTTAAAVLKFPEPAYSIYPWQKYDYNSSKLRYTYNSLVTPPSVYEYEMDNGTYHLLKRQAVLGGYDPRRYVSERIYAAAPDGSRIPISLVRRRGLKLDGSNPCYLTGYGAYGDNNDPYFSSSRLSLLDRGFVYAVAQVRGGQEMGRGWYLDGKLLNKKNSFTDFIACAEHLVKQGFTSSNKLVISGGSAGGLLMGAVVNSRPDLFRAAVLDVPFLDVINTMLDPTIPLTTAEYQEWGDPRDPQYYRYMLSYSPYDNIRAQDYPAMLVSTGWNDANVAYWEPAKWVAKLRTAKTDSNRLVLKTDMKSGHHGPSGRYGYLKDLAFEYAFILDVLGIRK
ncbi:S9 family peptidase [candidate division TA06 bacterium]|nr:S9 family peptidase [candidate division TA06 bacterium]